jgi:hypothetical protein
MERQILIMQMRKILLILPLFFLFLAFPAKADVYYIYNCGATFVNGTPDNPNVYILQNDINFSGSYGGASYFLHYYINCFNISASNIVLDLNSRSVNMNVTGYGDNYYHLQAFLANGQNITIKNGIVNVRTNIGGYYYGGYEGYVFLMTTSYSTLKDLQITANIGAAGGAYVNNPTTAINLNGKNNTLYNIWVEGAQIGTYFSSASYNNFTRGKIYNTLNYDLYLSSGSNYNYVCVEFNNSKVRDYGTGNSINVCLYAPSPTCNCTDWVAAECVSNTQRKYTRVCTPSGCDVETKYENDASCAPIAEYPWLSLVNIMFSPFWIIMVMVFGMSAAIEKKLQAGGIAFLAALLIFLFIFAFFTRSIPLWIPIIFLIMAVGYMIFRGRT